MAHCRSLHGTPHGSPGQAGQVGFARDDKKERAVERDRAVDGGRDRSASLRMTVLLGVEVHLVGCEKHGKIKKVTGSQDDGFVGEVENIWLVYKKVTGSERSRGVGCSFADLCRKHGNQHVFHGGNLAPSARISDKISSDR
jgi:hypothetical protein